MILEKLHTIFEIEPQLCSKNETFNFSIYHIKPKGSPFQLVITAGLANHDQPVTEKNQRFKNLELYMCLPEYWDLSKANWPIAWLNKLAEIPQKNKTWFGPGDTIPAGNPPQFVDEKLKTNYFILSEPILLAELLDQSDSSFQMLAVIPVFKKEFDYKMQNSATVLFEKFRSKNVTELIDIYREPVSRKKFMGLF